MPDVANSCKHTRSKLADHSAGELRSTYTWTCLACGHTYTTVRESKLYVEVIEIIESILQPLLERLEVLEKKKKK